MIWYFWQLYWPDNKATLFNKESNFYHFFQSEKIVEWVYWKDLELLLIEYHLSADKNIMPFKYALERKIVSSYSIKDKSISVLIPVILKDFFKLSEDDRMKKFCDDTIYAVNMIKERMNKKKLDVNITKLLEDLEKCNKEFLENYKELKNDYEKMKERYLIKREEKEKSESLSESVKKE